MQQVCALVQTEEQEVGQLEASTTGTVSISCMEIVPNLTCFMHVESTSSEFSG